MKIYIAGKITGLDHDEAFAAFEEAERQIIAAGHEPLNPMKLVDQTPGRRYEEYLADALRVMLVEGEAVKMIEGWTGSRGASIEHKIAYTLDIPVFYARDPLPAAILTEAHAG